MLAALTVSFAGSVYLILGLVVMASVWQARTDHNPIGGGASAVEWIVLGLWVLAPLVALGLWVRGFDWPSLPPLRIALGATLLGIAELVIAVALFNRL